MEKDFKEVEIVETTTSTQETIVEEVTNITEDTITQ